MIKKSKKLFEQIIFDTSIYPELLKASYPEFIAEIEKYPVTKKYGLYFSIIELNLGLIKSWVEYFEEVEDKKDISIAKAIMSDKYGRQSKNYIILDSLNTQFNDVTPNKDISGYLAQLEGTIFLAVTIINNSVKSFVGNFNRYELASFQVDYREEYGAFLKKCKLNRITELKNYLAGNSKKLKLMDIYINEQLKTKDNAELRKWNMLIKQALSDSSMCDTYRLNQKYGDIVIALELQRRHKLLTTDGSFDLLATAIDKPHIKLSKK